MSPVSEVNTCTRDVLCFLLRSSDRSLVIVDLPGVRESGQLDHEYTDQYHRILSEMELVLWVIKADDRALCVDELFWHKVMRYHRQQVLFVINQADKMAPSYEWDAATCTASVQ